MPDITNEEVASIANTWETATALRTIINRVGMTKFQIALREMYNANRLTAQAAQFTGMMSVTVNNWDGIKLAVNDRSDPVDRSVLITKISEAIAAENAATLSVLIPALIGSEMTLNAMPPIE